MRPAEAPPAGDEWSSRPGTPVEKLYLQDMVRLAKQVYPELDDQAPIQESRPAGSSTDHWGVDRSLLAFHALKRQLRRSPENFIREFVETLEEMVGATHGGAEFG